MLQTLRNSTKSSSMRAFLLVLVAGFAMWGIGDVFRSNLSEDIAIETGDVTIEAGEAAAVFDRTRRSYLPGSNNNEALAAGLLVQVLSDLSQRALFTAEASRLNLLITDEMVKDAIARNPLFLDDTGSFNPLLLRDVLIREGISEQELIQYIVHVENRDQITSAIAKGLSYPQSSAAMIAAWQAEQRQISYVELPITPGSVPEPSQAALSAWYAEKKSEFASPALRSITAAILAPETYIDHVTVTEEEVLEMYEARRASYSFPERRTIRQMVFTNQADAERAKASLDAGENFNAVADSLLNLSGDALILEEITENQLPNDALRKAVFSAEIGKVSGPVQSNFGQHFFIVDKIDEAVSASLDDVREFLIENLRNEHAIDRVYDQVAVFEDARDSGATLTEAAEQAGAQIITIDGMSINGYDENDEIIEGIATSTEFREMAWQQAVGDVSLLTEDEADSYFALRVGGERQARERPLDEVYPRALAAYKLEKAIISTRERAKTLISDGDFETAASKAGLDIITSPAFRQTGNGLDHQASSLIARSAFSLNTGESDLVETGAEGMIALRLEAILEGDEETKRLRGEQIKREFSQNLQSDTDQIIGEGLMTIHELHIRPATVERLLIGTQN